MNISKLPEQLVKPHSTARRITLNTCAITAPSRLDCVLHRDINCWLHGVTVNAPLIQEVTSAHLPYVQLI